MQISGSAVALITPMHDDGSVDKKTLSELVEWHISEGTTALIIAGSTGEGATLNEDEHEDIIRSVVQQVKKRVPVIAGSGVNSTTKTLKLSQHAKQAGADACLIVTPYYNKPPQRGLYAHYKFIAEQLNMPIILYNVPGRTACDLLPETVAQLAEVKHIVGIKEATGNIDRVKDIIELLGTDFPIYSGDDATALALMQAGGKGVISVTANIAPRKMRAMCDFALAGDFDKAALINKELDALHHDLFLESNPIPTKWALTQMQKIKAGIRLPLIPLDKRYHEKVKEAMHKAGIS